MPVHLGMSSRRYKARLLLLGVASLIILTPPPQISGLKIVTRLPPRIMTHINNLHVLVPKLNFLSYGCHDLNLNSLNSCLLHSRDTAAGIAST